MDRIKLFFYKIKVVLSYIPVIWESPTHDYYSIMYMMIFRLKQLLKTNEEIINKHPDISQYYSANTANVRVALTLFDRAYNDYYFDKAAELMKLKYGADVLKIHFERVLDENGNFIHATVKNEYENWDNAEEVEQYYRSLIKKYNRKQEKVNRLCWEYFVHYGQTWW
jgi:hypothetical protein